MKKVLLLKAGEAANPVRLAAGDYDRWFQEALAACSVLHRLDVVQAHLGQRVPRLADYDAVLITGSPLSVTRSTSWMERAAEALRVGAQSDVAVLGICFGHQLLGYAFGSRVVENPLGREIGTVEISLSAEGRRDPLFQGLGERFWVQATHQDIVERAPKGATALASNANADLQAMAIGPRVRGVQFHPELGPHGMQAVIQSRARQLAAEGKPLRALLSGIRPTPAGRIILENFLKRFC